jgi:hypothetical protein
MEIRWLAILALPLFLGSRASAAALGGPETGAYTLGPGQAVIWQVPFAANTDALAAIFEKTSPLVPLTILVEGEILGDGFVSLGNGSYVASGWIPGVDQVYALKVTNQSKTTPVVIELLTN